MKKIICAIIVLFSCFNVYSQYYVPIYYPSYSTYTRSNYNPDAGKVYKADNMFARNNSVMIGLTLGVSESEVLFNKKTGYCSEKPMLGVVSKIYGAVFNMGFYMNHSSSVDIDYHSNEDSGFYMHFGYNFPVAKWFSVAPLIGYSKHVIGDYDGSNWTIYNGNISNKFYHTGPSYSGFDYGVEISFDIPCGKICSLNVPVSLTRHIFYFGLGFTINIGNI